nr:MAG TPA: hypothetical protein [Caudoviricetes sp.]
MSKLLSTCSIIPNALIHTATSIHFAYTLNSYSTPR